MRLKLPLGCCLLLTATALLAQTPSLRLPAIISDNMAIQAGVDLPIWGWDAPNAKVEVSACGQTKSTVAGQDGKWLVKLSPLKAGGPYQIDIKGTSSVKISNVLAGEVWLASGQSNMEYQLEKVKDIDTGLANPEVSSIRLFRVPWRSSGEPESDCKARWVECGPKTATQFSAVAYFFGRALQKELKTPIGLIDASWGGTPAEAWTSIEALRGNTDLKRLADYYDKSMAEYPAAKAATEKKLAELEKQKAEAPDDKGWEARNFDDSAWKEMRLPQRWIDAGLNFNGKVWFRKTVELPPEWRGKDIILNLAKIDGVHTVYVDGEKLGGGYGYQLARSYKIPGALSNSPKLAIAVHIYHDTDRGGFWGEPGDMNLTLTSSAIPLAGTWKYAPALKTAKLFPYAANFPMGPGNRNLPSGDFNGMINPLVPFAIRGAIWYQGEGNSGQAKTYKTLFPSMIEDWRNRWGEGAFPFLFVQLSNTFDAKPEDRPCFAELREAQLETLKTPNTGMVVTIDIGDRNDVHPKNKWDVGLRLAKLALDGTYGVKQVCNGPLYDSMSIEASKIRIEFKPSTIGSGLAARGGGELKGFAIRGENGVWMRAKASIDGDDLLVWNEDLVKPNAVRYAWEQNPFDANLINKDGLPASPFRTDSDDSTWPIIKDENQEKGLK